MLRRVVPIALLLPLLSPAGCQTWYGLRLDLFPDGVETVVGVNVTPLELGQGPLEDVYGAQIGPLYSDVGSVTGLHVGGILARADEMTGVQAGLMVGGDGDVTGLTLAPLVFTPYRHTDLDGEFEGAATGVTIAGIHLDYPYVTGLTASGILRTRELTGLGVGYAFTDVRDRTVGVSIGLVNLTRRLKGVQIGLLNRVADRDPWWRWMPILRFGWDEEEDEETEE